MPKVVAIHQPVYLPWLGFFKKMMDCDTFVFLDDVQYEKNGHHNRNKIRTKDGSMWLTVPTRSSLNLLLNEVKIDNTSNWIEKHKKAIRINYSKAKYFDEFSKSLESIYEKKFNSLIDVNISIIELLMTHLKIKPEIIFSSKLCIEKKGSDRILEICKKLNANVYYSGVFGRDYLNLIDFKHNNIVVEMHNFIHPEYRQCYLPFVPNMSTIDLLFNEGENSREVLRNSKTEILENII